MTIPLIIGKNSNGENQLIDLSETALLMVSFSDEMQLKDVFKPACLADHPYKNINYLFSNSRRLQSWDINSDIGCVYLRDDPDSGNIKSRQALLKIVIDEIRRRTKLLWHKKIATFKRYHELNTWNEEKLPYQFLLLDDIWDIVRSKPKSLALNLVRIILDGPAVGIHTIFASEISYHNLLQQLVYSHPVITKALQKKYGVPEPKHLRMLGSELIFTTENFIYYRAKDEIDMMRLFKMPD